MRAEEGARGGTWDGTWSVPEALHHRTAKDGFDPREVPLRVSALLEKVVCTGFEKFGFYVVPSEGGADKHRDGRRVLGPPECGRAPCGRPYPALSDPRSPG
jgi:hypothetical protein